MADDDRATAIADGSHNEANEQELAVANTTQDIEPAKKVKKIIRKKKRKPARVQRDPATITSEPPPQTGVIFNIWYNKWSGGDRDTQANKTHAVGRCNIAEDSGYTKADNSPGAFFCIHFARGSCTKGSDCPNLHRLPTVTDIFNPTVDCFGREKFAGYRDDMGGVASFNRQNRTIYVGRIHVTDDIEEIVARHFAEWGQIERIRVLNTRGVAFITYSNLANAEFAKEAMAHQSLDHDEILNVRWATVDPNPMAQKREARRIEEQAAEAIRAALPAEYVAEIEGRDPEAKKRRRIEGSYGLDGYQAPDELWYRQLQGDEQRLALEAPGSSTMEQEYPQSSERALPAPQEEPATDGILSSSTLAALRKQNVGAKVATAKETKPMASLVGYGSDDDDSD